MTKPRNEIATCLSTIDKGELPGWVLSKTGSSMIVSSLRGSAEIPEGVYRSDDLAMEALQTLHKLGYDQDVKLHSSRPKRKKKVGAPGETQSSTVEATEEPSTEAASKIEKELPSQKKGRDQVIFVYPDEPQRLTLEELLPPEGENDDSTRFLYPNVVIDARIAEAFLERAAKTKNRQRRRTNVSHFKRLMLDGQFQVTHQGIAFNIYGELSDGQHRMQALVDLAKEHPDSTPEIVVDITYNMPIKTVFAFDGGAKRTNVDHANVAGIENPTIVARLVRHHHLYEETSGNPTRWGKIPALTPDELVERANKYGNRLQQSWAKVRPLRNVPNVNLTAAALWYFLATEAWDEAPVDSFIEGLAEMEWAYRDDPRKALYRWIGNAEERRTYVQHHLAQFMLAYNAYCLREPRKATRWYPKSGIPAPYSPESKPAKKK